MSNFIKKITILLRENTDAHNLTEVAFADYAY